MDNVTRVGGESAYTLQNAILVYGDSRRSFATLHDPIAAPNGGAPQLGAGRPVSTAFLKVLAGNLSHGLPTEILPPHVLVRTADVVVWWRPRSVAGVFYSVEREEKGKAVLRKINGKRVPHPALLFRAAKGALWVRALATNTRPTAVTPLFQAPYYNVNQSGGVCIGSMRVPSAHGLDALAQWEEAFFGSEFTHQLAGTALCRHPKGFVDMWAHLATERRPVFPSRWLVPAPRKQTAQMFVDSEVA